MVRRPGMTMVALAAAGLLLAGCGQGGQDDPQQAAQQPEQTSTEQAGPEQQEPAETTTVKPSKPKTTADREPKAPAKPALCKSADLELSLGQGDAGAGTVWRPLQFTNTSDANCVIQGFPGVSFVAGSDGHQVGAAAYRDGSKGAAVTLKPGATANAPVGFTQVRNFDPGDCKPTSVRGLRVYPPQETASMFLKNAGTGCANADLGDNQLKVQTIRAGKG